MACTKPFVKRVSCSLTDTIDAAVEQTVMTTPAADNATPYAESFGLADTITCKRSEELAEVVVSLIVAKFSYNLTDDLLKQKMTTYLKELVVENDDMLSFMSEETFPTPTSMGLDFKKLTIPVLGMLHTIAGMMVTVRRKSLYLTP